MRLFAWLKKLVAAKPTAAKPPVLPVVINTDMFRGLSRMSDTRRAQLFGHLVGTLARTQGARWRAWKNERGHKRSTISRFLYSSDLELINNWIAARFVQLSFPVEFLAIEDNTAYRAAIDAYLIEHDSEHVKARPLHTAT